jgi:hypothetical protein
VAGPTYAALAALLPGQRVFVLGTLPTKDLKKYVIFKTFFARNLQATIISFLFFKGSTVPEFLDEIQTKDLSFFLFAIHSHLYTFSLRFLFLQNHATSYSFCSSVTVHFKGERRKT